MIVTPVSLHLVLLLLMLPLVMLLMVVVVVVVVVVPAGGVVGVVCQQQAVGVRVGHDRRQERLEELVRREVGGEVHNETFAAD